MIHDLRVSGTFRVEGDKRDEESSLKDSPGQTFFFIC